MATEKITEERVQKVGQLAGFDWSKAWAVLQKIGPELQVILMTLLEEFANQPVIRGAQIPDVQLAEPTYAMCEAAIQSNKENLKDLDPAALLALLQVVGPLLSKIILGILSKRSTETIKT